MVSLDQLGNQRPLGQRPLAGPSRAPVSIRTSTRGPKWVVTVNAVDCLTGSAATTKLSALMRACYDVVRAAIEEAEQNPEQPMPPVARPLRPNKSVPVAVRLSPTNVKAVEDLAISMGLTPSILIRGWIQRGLAERREQSLAAAVDQLAVDVQRLRELIA